MSNTSGNSSTPNTSSSSSSYKPNFSTSGTSATARLASGSHTTRNVLLASALLGGMYLVYWNTQRALSNKADSKNEDQVRRLSKELEADDRQKELYKSGTMGPSLGGQPAKQIEGTNAPIKK